MSIPHFSVAIFGEYRYSWVDAEATVSGFGIEVPVSGTYDFGLVRAGVNFVF